jgi:hypothetical protein
MNKKIHRGLTFLLGFGKYAGFYISYKGCFRIVLGWIVFTIYPYDYDLQVIEAFKESKKENEG